MGVFGYLDFNFNLNYVNFKYLYSRFLYFLISFRSSLLLFLIYKERLNEVLNLLLFQEMLYFILFIFNPLKKLIY